MNVLSNYSKTFSKKGMQLIPSNIWLLKIMDVGERRIFQTQFNKTGKVLNFSAC